jgi:hypothetical protein
LSPGQIDGGQDIFHRGLLGIKANGKKVLLGVIAYFHDSPESGDGGAHGVGAAASHKPALLYQARHPEINALVVHGESSVYLIHPASAFTPVGWLLEWDNLVNLTKFCLSVHHWTRPGTGYPCQMEKK